MILIADRTGSVLNLLKSVAGFDRVCVGCDSYAAAVEHMKQQRMAAAVVSHDLSDRHGFELLSHLQVHYPRVPAIYLTADTRKETIISAMRRGAKDLLELPLDAPALIEAIQRVKRFSLHDRDSGETSPSAGTSPAVSAAANGPPPFSGNEPSHKPRIDVLFFGTFRVAVNGQCLQHWPSRKGRSIFAYLAFNESKPIFREQLIDMFWPKVFPESGRNCLNVAIHHLRQLFQKGGSLPNVLLLENDSYFLNPELQVTTDVKRFLTHWNRARFMKIDNQPSPAVDELELAASVYQGDFMSEERYEEWTIPERENLREIYIEVLESLSRIYSLNGKPKTAIELCKSILEKDNCREKVHRRLMLCYLRIGKRDRALRQFQKCTDILKRELDVSPSSGTLDLYRKIRSGNHNIPPAR